MARIGNTIDTVTAWPIVVGVVTIEKIRLVRSRRVSSFTSSTTSATIARISRMKALAQKPTLNIPSAVGKPSVSRW